MTKPRGRRNYKLTKEELAEIVADTKLAYSEAAQSDAEAARAQAEAERVRVETKGAAAVAASHELMLTQKKIEHEEIMAQDEHHQVYQFGHQVGQTSVRDCMENLSLWHRIKPRCDMEIIFTSPGGCVISGLALFDYIQYLKRQGHRIVTKTYGMAASMAGILLQAGTERVSGKEAWVLIHEGSFGAVGDVGKVMDTVDWVKRIGQRIVDIFATRAAEKTKKPAKDIAIFIRKNWDRKDWWLDSEQMLRHGFVDRVE